MTHQSPSISFAIPGVLACLLLLVSAMVIIMADSLRGPILIGSSITGLVATITWIIGITKTTKSRTWGTMNAILATVSLLALLILGTIIALWMLALNP